jgi:oligoribonuclease NrnB/cAMP/cGMP phosphodiesterase (DHH superfamily)
MPERTWEAIGRPAMIPSLGGIGLFRGKLVTLCGKLTQIYMNANGTSTEEDFEIIKFIQDNALFTTLLGKPWIERDQAIKKEEEKVLEQQRQELKDFMTRRIAQLIEEQENKSNISGTRSPDVKVARALEDSQKIKVYVSDIEEVLPLSLRRESQQREVTMFKENKNQNGKRITEMKLTGNKDRKLSKKRAKIDKLQKIPEGASQKENLKNLNFIEISDQRHRPLRRGKAI